MASTQGTIVRQATREDVPIILQLIQELAIYEKELDSVKATHESLLKTLAFAPSPASPSGDSISPSRPARTILVCSSEGTVEGMALYFYNYSTWTSKAGIYLEDLYVRETARGKGYGQILLGELAKEVLEMGGERLDWSVLKWNAPSIGFYESLGAQKMDEWMGCRVVGDALTALAKKAI